jgi:acyl-CoA synthetase (AMP-forming)/AMP-acid ligase II
MPSSEQPFLWGWTCAAGRLLERFIANSEQRISLGDFVRGSCLGGRLEELGGRSVLLATSDQLAAASALLELDGVARRIVIGPPDLSFEHVPSIIAAGEVDALVSDRTAPEVGAASVERVVTCRPRPAEVGPTRRACRETEWILLTSGTTGRPKLVLHTLSTLTGAITRAKGLGDPILWSTFYDIRRYGGLQVLLRALIGGGSLLLPGTHEPTEEFLRRAGRASVSHISGTPSHWRRALMSPAAREISPRYVRLSGEIADEAILSALQAFFPNAKVAHAFASTEAGVAFEVGDGHAGFPASLVGQTGGSVELRVENGSLRIRSRRTAIRYVGEQAEALADEDGFVDTGDMVELKEGRYHFVGRRGGIINVGGLKVHPEEVEAVINRHPRVRMSLVKARKNPLTGAVVAADVVVNGEPGHFGEAGGAEALRSAILEACHRALAPHKVPAVIRFVDSVAVAPSGKLVRT